MTFKVKLQPKNVSVGMEFLEAHILPWLSFFNVEIYLQSISKAFPS